jgi:YfiH family protein
VPDEHLTLRLDGGTVLFTTRRGGVSEGPYASLEPRAPGPTTTRRASRPTASACGRWRARRACNRAVRCTARAVVVDAGDVEDADGQVSTRADAAPIVLVADCLPVALVAPEAVAMLHAGWRGLAGGVVAEGVGALRRAGASRVAAAVGPGAGPCCYEVGDEVRAVFGTRARTVDLGAIARGQLAAAGVEEVHDVGLCTMCDPERFFSHRRDGGVTGRQAGVVWRS